MATKETTGGNTQSLGKKKPRRKRKYDCAHPPHPPYGLREIVKKIVNEPAFAEFIRDLLCRSNQGDDSATKCLELFYKSDQSDLGALCIKTVDMGLFLRCTEQNRLLDAIAYAYGTSKHRHEKKKR